MGLKTTVTHFRRFFKNNCMISHRINALTWIKSESLHTTQVAHQAGAYPGFCSTKQIGVFLLPPGWDTSPSRH